MIDTLITIGDHFPSSLFIIQAEGRPGRPCIYANNKFFETTGYDPKVAIGKSLSFLLGKLSDQDTITFIRESFRDARAILQDIVNYKADGSPFLNRVLLLPLKYEGNLYYIGIQHDLTHDRGLSPFNTKLSRIHEGEIKHVMNNALSIILSCSKTLEKKDISEERREKISKSLEREFLKMREYCLDIENQSEFEEFDPYDSLKVSNF